MVFHINNYTKQPLDSFYRILLRSCAIEQVATIMTISPRIYVKTRLYFFFLLLAHVLLSNSLTEEFDRISYCVVKLSCQLSIRT